MQMLQKREMSDPRSEFKMVRNSVTQRMTRIILKTLPNLVIRNDRIHV
jgi:hypothetical protein